MGKGAERPRAWLRIPQLAREASALENSQHPHSSFWATSGAGQTILSLFPKVETEARVVRWLG